MAKRFTDNEKWKDAWFMDLPSKYKLFWLYILDECNHAGVWKVNFKVASFCIGEHLEYSEVKRLLKDRITILNDENWYVKKFIKYQYKCDIEGLNSKNKAHLSAIKILNEYDYFKPLTSPLLGVKDKDKDKDKDLDKDLYNVLYDLDKLKTIYLQNEILVKAFIDNKANKIKDAKELEERLSEFITSLTEQGRHKETFKEFSTYFRNWNKKIPKKATDKEAYEKAIRKNIVF